MFSQKCEGKVGRRIQTFLYSGTKLKTMFNRTLDTTNFENIIDIRHFLKQKFFENIFGYDCRPIMNYEIVQIIQTIANEIYDITLPSTNITFYYLKIITFMRPI